jgi:hypothetical protein
MANTRLTRTAGSPTLNTKYTISVWVKRASLGGDDFIMDGRQDANNRFKLAFQSANKLEIWNSHGGSDTWVRNSNRVFRDTSGWYHIVLAVDTTDSTALDRVKLYINGVRETSFASTTNPSQNDANNVINESGAGVHIGDYSGGSNAFDGCMSHFHFCDGTALAPTVFGETDSTTGEWKIKTSPSFTLGNNGFTILKDGNTITDQSTNSNDFSLASGTLTNTEDCPSNVFATIDQQYYINRAQTVTLSSGNTKVVSSGNNWKNFVSTLTMGSGKYYCEYKVDAWNGSNLQYVGVVADWLNLNKSSHPDSFAGNATNGIGYGMNGNYTYNNSDTSGGATYAANDIIGVALDATNSKLYFSKNGSWQFSGDPSNNSGGISIAANLNYFFVFGHYGSQGGSFNFGNGFFGTTAISSEGTNASGIGKFEYDVPTGFAALSTKGLNN